MRTSDRFNMRFLKVGLILATAMCLCAARTGGPGSGPEPAGGGAPASWVDWGEREDEVVLLGSYTDYAGARGSIYLSPRGPNRVWIMDHDLATKTEWNRPAPQVGDASGLKALPCGTRGKLRYFGLVRMPGGMPVAPARRSSAQDRSTPGLAVTEGTFLDFAPEAGAPPLSELLARASDPWLLGLLVREPEVQKKALSRIQRLHDPRARVRALSGMFLAGAKTAARKYLAQVALPRDEDNRQEPDFKVLGPWLNEGFERVPQVPCGEEDLKTSRVRYLLPAVKVWLRTGSAAATQAAYYDAMLGKPETLLLPLAPEGPAGEGYPPPAQGPFERGGFEYSDVLRALAPGFYRAIRDAESHILGYPGYYRNVPVLEVRLQGKRRYLGILDPQTGDMLACRDPRGHGPVAFGSRADLLIYAPSGIAEEEEGRILRLRWLAPDPAGVIKLLKQTGLGAGLGYLSRAAQERAGGFTWREWEEFVRDAAKGHANGFSALRVREVLAVSPGRETADALRALLPEIAHASRYVDTGQQGLAIVAAYLALRDYVRAAALLDELPGVIGQSRETYDGQGDIGWENRCGIEAFRILRLRLAGAASPRPSEELRQYWGSVREQFEEVTQAVDGGERGRWLRTLLQAGVSGE